MIICQAHKEDMNAVLALIQELATFEKEPDAMSTSMKNLAKK